MNRVIFIGNLVRDPTSSETPNGKSVCKFSLAVRRPYAKEGDKDADFFNITAFNKLAENCAKYLSKGSKVFIEGSIQTGEYEDKKGVKRSTVDIIATDVEFIGRQDKEPSTAQETAQAPPKTEAKPKETAEQLKLRLSLNSNKKKSLVELQPVEDEDLPF